MSIRKLLLLIVIVLSTMITSVGQSDMGTPEPVTTVEPEMTETVMPFIPETGEVAVLSAFVRALPTRDSESVASVFERDTLEIMGRNIDGLWFEVRRQNRNFSLGWMSAELLDIDFLPETLPMTDTMTGLVGNAPIPEEHVAVYLTAEANLRIEPVGGSEVLAVIPLGAIVPATGRDALGTWVFVNYRGTEGWLNSVTFRNRPIITDLPNLRLEDVAQLPVVVIPPEVQLSQLVAFRDFVQASATVSAGLVPFWDNVLIGEVMPCEPPDFVAEYLITANDVQELPELNRYVPRYNQGVILLNESIEPLTNCGVLQSEIVTEARNDAINARIIMDATVEVLDGLEELILETNNLDTSPTSTP